MRYLGLSIILASLLLSPSNSSAQSIQIEKKDSRQEQDKIAPGSYRRVRITLKNGSKVEGEWLNRRDDATIAIREKGTLRLVPNSDIKEVKESNGSFWKKVWGTVELPVFIISLPVLIPITMINCKNGC